MNKDLDSSIKNMVQALSSEKDLVRTKARRALVAAGKEAVPFLVEALKNAEPLVRWEATKALGEIGDTSAAPALVKALEDDDFDVRWLAAEGLIKLNVGGVKPLLQALVIDPYSVSLREAAHHGIASSGNGGIERLLGACFGRTEEHLSVSRDLHRGFTGIGNVGTI